jgi:hypothetical protein
MIYYGGVVEVAKNDKAQTNILRWKFAAGQAFFFALV